MLRDCLDNLMGNFEISDSAFFSQYFNATQIFDSHRHTTVEGTTTDETTGADLPNVQVLITPSTENFEEMTDVQGSFKQQISP